MREAGPEYSPLRSVTVLSVSSSKADHAELSEILEERRANSQTNCTWEVCPVSGVALAVEALSRQQIPIVIAESDLFPDTWQAMLEYISGLADPPLLIVASRLADERLWAEALNLGAWDVLAKPFDKQEVGRVVFSAWRHWQERPRRPKETRGGKTATEAPGNGGGRWKVLS